MSWQQYCLRGGAMALGTNYLASAKKALAVSHQPAFELPGELANIYDIERLCVFMSSQTSDNCLSALPAVLHSP